MSVVTALSSFSLFANVRSSRRKCPTAGTRFLEVVAIQHSPKTGALKRACPAVDDEYTASSDEPYTAALSVAFFSSNGRIAASFKQLLDQVAAGNGRGTEVHASLLQTYSLYYYKRTACIITNVQLVSAFVVFFKFVFKTIMRAFCRADWEAQP